MRLDKFLAHKGFGSRKEVKKLISQGHIEVDNQIVKDVGFNFDPNIAQVTFMGNRVHYQEYYYYLLNKPPGVISATEDRWKPTVLDLLEDEDRVKGLFPVGRLDIDTTGLLLLTNNGQLSHQLLSPKKKVKKTYRVLIQGMIGEEDVNTFQQGIDLGDFITQPGSIKVIENIPHLNQCIAEITISEGKFHQVKRMVAYVEKEVLELHRIKMGPLVLDDHLEIGQYRPLSELEMQALLPYGIEF